MPDPAPADRHPDLDSLAAEIVESWRLLAAVEEAPAAEAWASGAVAEWYQLGGGRLANVIEAVEPIAGSLIDWIESGRPSAGAEGLAWAAAVGSARPVRASNLADPTEKSERVLVVTYEDSAGAAHDLSTTIYENRIIDVAAGPPGLIDDVLDGPDDSQFSELGFVASPVDLDAVNAELAGLVATCDPRRLSPRARLDLPLLCRRLGIDPTTVGPWTPEPVAAIERTRDVEDDRYAADLVVSALRLNLAAEPPPEVATAIERFRARVDAGAPDALAVLAVAGSAPVDLEAASASDSAAGSQRSSPSTRSLLQAVGAYLAPVDLSVHPADEREPISALEPADWVGVILGLVRVVAANPLDGEECVQFINRCPEIATTIPARDAPMVAWAFDLVLYGWEVTGVLDDEGLLTPAGRWLLPRAAQQVWTSGATG